MTSSTIQSAPALTQNTPQPSLRANAQEIPAMRARALAYRNDRVVRRIATDFDLTIPEAEAVFTETLRFLFLCGAYHGPFAPSPRIDEGWHTFLLFTEEYAEFCRMCLGRMVHHRPHDEADGPVLDTMLIRRTRATAEAVFGELSPLWRYSHAADCCDSCSCESCSGSTNCQN